MAHPIRNGKRSTGLIIRFLPILGFALTAFAQTNPSPACSTTANNLNIRQEGLTEPLGTIVLSCSGVPNSVVTTNITMSVNAAITNRVSPSNLSALGTPNILLTVNTGGGPVAQGTPMFQAQNVIAFNGVSIAVPATGNFSIQIANVRAAVTQYASGQGVIATLSTTALALNNPNLLVATVQRGLLATYSSNGITCVGSPLPTTINLTNLFATGTIFVSTRITEGFGGAFLPKDANSDTGTRIVVSYSNFPAGSQVFVPDVIAGSDAVQPTAGGDLGETQSGGLYTPAGAGSLLLARVLGTDANGAGGSPVLTKAVIAGPTSFNGATAVPLTNGAGIAVYEVVDSNPADLESAQFPTFLGLAAAPNATPVIASDSVSFGPISTVAAATATDPIPRFAQLIAPTDCTAIGDCGASYFPALTVDQTSLQFAAPAGGSFQSQYVRINNKGGGLLLFTASLTFQSGGTSWLAVTPSSGANNATVRLDASPATLGPGTYQATLIVNAGAAGSRTVPVTFTVGPPTVTINSITNAATLQAGPVVAGSLATIQGLNLGTNASVTFDGIPATVLYNSATQINLQVPAAVAPPKPSSQVVVSVNGNNSNAQLVQLAAVAPGIFGALNQDGSVNAAATPAHSGQIVQLFATGLISAASGPVSVGVAGQGAPPPLFAGQAPGLPGVQQVNFTLPAGLTPGRLPITVCAVGTTNQPVCSPDYNLAFAQ